MSSNKSKNKNTKKLSFAERMKNSGNQKQYPHWYLVPTKVLTICEHSRDRKMKTLDEERKEQAFYEATEKFLPIDMQNIIWERFLARCVCGRCGGIPTYNRSAVETSNGPVLTAHLLCKCSKCIGEKEGDKCQKFPNWGEPGKPTKTHCASCARAENARRTFEIGGD